MSTHGPKGNRSSLPARPTDPATTEEGLADQGVLGVWGAIFAGYLWAFSQRLGSDASIQTQRQVALLEKTLNPFIFYDSKNIHFSFISFFHLYKQVPLRCSSALLKYGPKWQAFSYMGMKAEARPKATGVQLHGHDGWSMAQSDRRSATWRKEAN